MPSIIEELEKYFGKRNIYEIFEVKKESTEKDIKAAFRTLSIKYHPDKNKEKDRQLSTTKFQLISKCYAILSDQSKRQTYDETGLFEGDDASFSDLFKSGNVNWEEYWRAVFPQISVDDIEQFEQSYKGSDEETADLIKLYQRYKGDMDLIMDNMLCATYDDESRYFRILNQQIESGTLKKFKKFVNESTKVSNRRKKRFQREASMAKKAVLSMNESNNSNSQSSESHLSGLSAIIRANKSAAREKDFDSFLDKLASKYTNSKVSLSSIEDPMSINLTSPKPTTARKRRSNVR